MTPRLGAPFFDRPVLQVAPDLLGAVVTSVIGGQPVAVRLTEVEAYDGVGDPGSHASRGRTPRNATMFGPPGLLYVYFTYGMHYCANLVCGAEGSAHAVLMRAGEVISGVALAEERRTRPGAAKPIPEHRLASGPANLAKVLGFTGQHNGLDLTTSDAPVWVQPPVLVPEVADKPKVIRTGPRVGVSGPGGDGTAYPWRFWLEGEASVSAYRPGVKRARRHPTR